MWDLSSPTCGILAPHPGIKPTSSVLQNGFLTTRTPGKSRKGALKRRPIWYKGHHGHWGAAVGFLGGQSQGSWEELQLGSPSLGLN